MDFSGCPHTDGSLPPSIALLLYGLGTSLILPREGAKLPFLKEVSKNLARDRGWM